MGPMAHNFPNPKIMKMPSVICFRKNAFNNASKNAPVEMARCQVRLSSNVSVKEGAYNNYTHSMITARCNTVSLDVARFKKSRKLASGSSLSF